MESLLLKLVLTPCLIGLASLVGRRWGPAVSGWLVGLPFTSAPVTFFLALDHGLAFASKAAAGTLSGTASQAGFCVVYARIAGRSPWPIAVAVGTMAFGAGTVVLQLLAPPLPIAFAMVIASLLLGLALMQRAPAMTAIDPRALPRWDIPARMVVATAFVLVLTGLAPAFGPRLSGLLAPFPLYAALLTTFAHHLQGPATARGVLRGLLLGLFSFAAFFLVVAAVIQRGGIATAFLCAIATALSVQAVSLWILHSNRIDRAVETGGHGTCT